MEKKQGRKNHGLTIDNVREDHGKAEIEGKTMEKKLQIHIVLS